MCIYHRMNLERKIGNIPKSTLFFLTQNEYQSIADERKESSFHSDESVITKSR